MTISQGLGWMKMLQARHQELVLLRSENSRRIERISGEGNILTKIDPTYDVRLLDRLVNSVAKEIRRLDEGIKEANATLHIPNYQKDEAVLGELQ